MALVPVSKCVSGTINLVPSHASEQVRQRYNKLGTEPWRQSPLPLLCGRAITPVSTYRTNGTTKEASRLQNSVHGVVRGKPEGPQLSNSLAGVNSSRG